MIEFGAGGQIVQSNEPAVTAAAPSAPAAAAAEGDAADAEAPHDNAVTATDGAAVDGAAAPTTVPEAAQLPTPIPTVVPTTNTRRKRKAKGWFCPVCRQRRFFALCTMCSM